MSQELATHTPSQHAETKQTPLCSTHKAYGAKMVDFSGWDMPLQYSKVLEEHMAVRQAGGLFDVSHMGIVTLSNGSVENTRAELNGLVPQDLSKLVPGKAVYTQFLNPEGGILDDIIVYQLPEPQTLLTGEIMVICNASNTAQDIQWMTQHLSTKGIQVQCHTETLSLLAFQGPVFSRVLAELGLPETELPKRFCIKAATLKTSGDAIPVLLARTGYTGEDGVEIIVPNAQVVSLWKGILSAGEKYGVLPVGLAARDTLRIEAAYPLYGHDISEKDTPLEAGLGWSVKLNTPEEFIGKKPLLEAQESCASDKPFAKRFQCFKLRKKTIPRQHDPILLNGTRVGEVTSGSISPILNEPIGMGYIQTEKPLKTGDLIQIQVRNACVDAEIVDRPFYKVR